MTKKCFIVFPNQLFIETIYADSDFQIFLVEEDLFFKQYNFHKQKILFHRSSMKFYQEYLLKKGFNVQYVNSYDNESDIIELIRKINNLNYTKIEIYDPVDYLLLRRIKRITSELKIDLVIHDSKLFINSTEELKYFFKESKQKFFQTSFYKSERKKEIFLLILEVIPREENGHTIFKTERNFQKMKFPQILTIQKRIVMSLNLKNM